MDKQFVLCLSGMQGNLQGAVGLSVTANAGVHCSASLAYSPGPRGLPTLKNHEAVIHDAPHFIPISHAARPARAIRTRKAGGRKGLISISDAASPACCLGQTCK